MTPLRDLLGGLRAAGSSPNVRFLLALTATLIALASAFYRWAEGWSLLDSVYFSVITIATVGYGDLSPQTAAGKIFTIGYVLIGLGVFVAAASAIADSIITASRRDDERKDRE